MPTPLALQTSSAGFAWRRDRCAAEAAKLERPAQPRSDLHPRVPRHWPIVRRPTNLYAAQLRSNMRL
jgi:hypothetical protein